MRFEPDSTDVARDDDVGHQLQGDQGEKHASHDDNREAENRQTDAEESETQPDALWGTDRAASCAQERQDAAATTAAAGAADIAECEQDGRCNDCRKPAGDEEDAFER